MNRRRRDMWFGCLFEYLKVSSRACQIIMCVNGEHGLKRNDIEFLKRVHEFNLNIQVVLTKIDKVKKDKLYYRMIDISN
jgi:GTP-binding protein EngB required for normal cell division